MLRNYSISSRLFCLLALVALFVAAVVWAFYGGITSMKEEAVRETQKAMLDGQKQKLLVGTHALALALGQAVGAVADPAGRVEAIRGMVDPIRFEDDKSGYYFVYQGTVNVALPPKKEVQGKDLGENKDSGGVYYVRELAARARSGGGFVEYVFPKPGQGDQPKLSYAEMIPGTDMWIGTGIYIDNVDKEKARIAGVLDASTSSILRAILGAVGVVFAILAVLCIAITRSIVRPIREAATAAQDIASGNLDVRLNVSGKDEAARLEIALNTMADALRDNIRDITAKTALAEEKARQADQAKLLAEEASNRAEAAKSEGMADAAMRLESVAAAMTGSTKALSGRAEAIRSRTVHQRDRIQETATAMEEMNATVLEVAKNAGQAATEAESSRRKAQEGQNVVDGSVTSMRAIREQAQSLSANMTELGRMAEDIGRIMTVILDIADQTNLLALNAAIEAARAGDAGRGFAVVADEVRKLAEKTMGATKEVGDSINAIQNVARENVAGMERTTEAITEATELSGKSGQMLREIVDSAQSSAGQINSIATAAEEQSAASEEINRAIEEINGIALDITSTMEETVTDIHALTEQADALRGVIGSLLEDAGQGGKGDRRSIR
ncbi:HAMP domain-containing protein [Desulfovibrio sulfodismutans]|uniref:HAMP domain-containing protein n=1 Tax=Desulfolutivibrio sulfodismutans TaxID=63561 RepID=A0A7K3NMS9_9BACT|nr:methyl-accepting chemotaxis protein [Desulfolutivibrio sulfodismutans]NDY57478.1 HAMP domain-containing protein [Desulfolutivibrio sulfodismutans]QLA14304.1 HAMP domain-containing protein [Desulfolutivibrio sulfodismutans DSM 3696]